MTQRDYQKYRLLATKIMQQYERTDEDVSTDNPSPFPPGVQEVLQEMVKLKVFLDALAIKREARQASGAFFGNRERINESTRQGKVSIYIN